MTQPMRWMADGPTQIVPALRVMGVEQVLVLYPHADKTSADPDFDGILIVDREDLHHLLGWPHAKSMPLAQKAATLYAGEIKSARVRYPKAQIMLYGVPNPWLWISQDGLVVPIAAANEQNLSGCDAWYAEALAPILDVTDGLCVSCYESAGPEKQNRDYWIAQVELARRLRSARSADAKWPIVATTSPCEMVNGMPSTLRSLEGWVALQVSAMLEAKPDVVAVWGAWDYWIGLGTAPPKSSNDMPLLAATRQMLAQFLAALRVPTPNVDDHGGWAGVRAILDCCVANSIYTRISAAALETARLSIAGPDDAAIMDALDKAAAEAVAP